MILPSCDASSLERIIVLVAVIGEGIIICILRIRLLLAQLELKKGKENGYKTSRPFSP